MYLSRPLHPISWWIWAGATAFALIASGNGQIGGAVLVATAIIVHQRKSDQPWSGTYAIAVKFILFIIAIRILIAIVIGVPLPGQVIFTLPLIETPSWMSGIRIGGAVTVERLASTLSEIFIIVGVIALFATATSLTSPHQILRSIPFAFYQLSLVLAIATSILPQLSESLSRIKEARFLRGQPTQGIHHWKAILIPLLEESLERALDLAASMESRGFGQKVRRSKYRPAHWGMRENLLVAVGLLAMALLPRLSQFGAITALTCAALLLLFPLSITRRPSLS
jgi:energy-coupling factor transporter transmembrane protein EcfT